MGLSKEELLFIDTYLQNSAIDYVDVRLELTDHIAATIECELEQNSSSTFYDVFKNYMEHHKKNLLENYEVQKTKLRDKIILRFLKSFVAPEVLFLVMLAAILSSSYDFSILKEYYATVNFGIFILMLLYYYIRFYKTKKTSVGSSLLSLIVFGFYLTHYVRNPLDMFFLIPVLIFGYTVFRRIEHKIDEKWTLIIAIICVVLLVPFFLWFDDWSKQFVTDTILVGYFFLQLILWYVLFRTLRKYKSELDEKFSKLFV